MRKMPRKSTQKTVLNKWGDMYPLRIPERLEI